MSPWQLVYYTQTRRGNGDMRHVIGIDAGGTATRAVLLDETGLVTRWYVPLADVHRDLLEPSEDIENLFRVRAVQPDVVVGQVVGRLRLEIGGHVLWLVFELALFFALGQLVIVE